MELAKPPHHRFVEHEPLIPFQYRICYEDERLIIIDKPHFLATTPRGMWYRQTALMRLREAFSSDEIAPAHRLDRMTAGIVVFTRHKEHRGAYQKLFQEHRVEKVYECVAPLKPPVTPRYGTVQRVCAPAPFPLLRRSRIVKQRGKLQAFEEAGAVNAMTRIERTLRVSAAARATSLSDAVCKRQCVYELHPVTGKTHQLRVHMSSLGLPIQGDPWYPRAPEPLHGVYDPASFIDDFAHPLQLVARSLAFRDPYSGKFISCTSTMPLQL